MSMKPSEIDRIAELNDFTDEEKDKLAKDEPVGRPFVESVEAVSPEPTEIDELRERLAALEKEISNVDESI